MPLPFLANFGNEATLEPIVVKFSQETLAEMIGTARSRVGFFMNKFSDFQFSVVFDVAARERLIMRPLRRRISACELHDYRGTPPAL